MKKKLIIFSLILCLILVFAVACGENQTNTDDTQTESDTSTDTSSDTSTDSGNTSTDTGASDTTDTDTDGESTDTDEENGDEGEVNVKQNWQDDGELKILAIGNSFSDDAMEYVYQVAKDAGVEKITLGNMYIGGCSLSTHLANAKGDKGAYTYRTNTNGTWSSKNGVSIKTAVTSEDWDFITFQQVSGYSGVESSYDDLNELISIVEPLNPSARLAWHMTWAYKVGSTHSDFPKYNKDQMTMYNAIVNAVNSKILTNDKIEIVIPSGTAVQNVRTSFIGDTTRDGYHLSLGIGRYIASVTFLRALTGLTVDNPMTRPNEIDAYELQAILESVDNALKTPYLVTESSYPEKDESVNVGMGEVPEGYVQLTASEMGLTAASFYNSSGSNVWNDTASSWSSGFMATKKFTREELPVGSIIEIASGWQYRPEGWSYTGKRPDAVSVLQVVVDEAWWGTYTERAFNISQIGHTTSNNLVITLSPDEVANSVFRILVPNEN